MDYAIEQDFVWQKLTEKVNARIKEGYEPIGGISTTTIGNNSIVFTQALIKGKKHEQRKS